MNNLVHDLCYLTVRHGRIVPSLVDEGTELSSLRPTGALTLHAFLTADEANAFIAGIRETGVNHITATAGDGNAGRLVIVDVKNDDDRDPDADLDVRLVDHGAAAIIRAHRSWGWLTALHDKDSRPENQIDSIIPEDGRAPTLTVGGFDFVLEESDGDIIATLTHDVSDQLLRCEIHWDEVTRDKEIWIHEGILSFRHPKHDYENAVAALLAIAKHVRHLISEKSATVWMAQIRKDPTHCRIVELMLEGWTLFQHKDHAAILHPPEGDRSKKSMRTLTHAMVGRLIAANLIRVPILVQRRGITDHFSYEIGDLANTAVRRPKPVETSHDS